MKKILNILLSFILILGIFTAASADITKESANKKDNIPLVSYDIQEEISMQNKNGTFKPKYKYIKVYYKNYGKANTNIYIQDGNGKPLKITGDSALFETGPNSNNSKIIKLSTSKTYTYNITTDGMAAEVMGKFVIKSAKSENDL